MLGAWNTRNNIRDPLQRSGVAQADSLSLSPQPNNSITIEWRSLRQSRCFARMTRVGRCVVPGAAIGYIIMSVFSRKRVTCRGHRVSFGALAFDSNAGKEYLRANSCVECYKRNVSAVSLREREPAPPLQRELEERAEWGVGGGMKENGK